VSLLRRGTGASWRDAFGAFMIWQSTALVVARASVQGLFAREAEFLRTPKTTEEGTWWDAVKGNRGETVLALLGFAGICSALTKTGGFAGPLTAGLLLWPTIAFATAPINSLAARRASLPAELRARRRTEYERYFTKRRVTAAAGGMAAAAAGAAAVVALLAPGNVAVVLPQLVAPAQGHHVHYGGVKATVPRSRPSPPTLPATGGPPSSTPTIAPSSAGPTTTSTSPSPSPSPSLSPSGSPSQSTSPSPTSSPSPSVTSAALASPSASPSSSAGLASPSPAASSAPA
jgi:hypothetical protein